MKQTQVSKLLLGMAKEVLSMEFPTKDALNKYLDEHPDADRSKHKVVETKKDAPKAEPKSEPRKRPSVHELVKEHVTFMWDLPSESNPPAFFSHYDEGDEANFGITKEDAHRAVRLMKPKAKAVLKKHGMEADLVVSEGKGDDTWVSLDVKNIRKDGKKISLEGEAVADMFTDMERAAPWRVR